MDRSNHEASSLDEQELIQRYFARLGAGRSDVVLGVGDDAAIVSPPVDAQMVLTTDTVAQGVHFPLALPADAVGYRAVAVNFSDLAAMGALPRWILLALTIPDAVPSWLEGFAAGIDRILRRYDAALIGGNVTRGPLSITVTAIGSVPTGGAVRRSMAQAGDDLYVTGTLGGGKAGLRALLEGEAADSVLAEGFARPQARVEVGQAVAGLVNAAMDISDGLIGDLGKLVQASGGLGARIDVDTIPCAVGATLEDALGPSDDYELLFAASPENGPRLSSLKLECKLSRIGRLTTSGGIYAGNRCLDPASLGYRHF